MKYKKCKLIMKLNMFLKLLRFSLDIIVGIIAIIISLALLPVLVIVAVNYIGYTIRSEAFRG